MPIRYISKSWIWGSGSPFHIVQRKRMGAYKELKAVLEVLAVQKRLDWKRIQDLKKVR